MQYKYLYFIVNPGAGSAAEVGTLIPEVFNGSDWQWQIIELQPKDSCSDIIKPLLQPNALIAVCGGDGSITEAAGALIGTEHPLAIVPGGTANVLSKELGIPQDIKESLALLRDGKFKLLKIDTGTVNGRPFLLRVNMGIMAQMITEADAGLKETVGQLAYGVSALKTVWQAEPVLYTLNIDGAAIEIAGVSLTVTNSGHMGVGSLQMYPDISINDGLLDILVLKDAGVLSIAKAAGSALFDTETDAIFHRVCKHVSIGFKDEQLYLCDDCEARANSLDIEVAPASLNVIVPIDK